MDIIVIEEVQGKPTRAILSDDIVAQHLTTQGSK